MKEQLKRRCTGEQQHQIRCKLPTEHQHDLWGPIDKINKKSRDSGEDQTVTQKQKLLSIAVQNRATNCNISMTSGKKTTATLSYNLKICYHNTPLKSSVCSSKSGRSRRFSTLFVPVSHCWTTDVFFRDSTAAQGVFPPLIWFSEPRRSGPVSRRASLLKFMVGGHVLKQDIICFRLVRPAWATTRW